MLTNGVVEDGLVQALLGVVRVELLRVRFTLVLNVAHAPVGIRAKISFHFYFADLTQIIIFVESRRAAIASILSLEVDLLVPLSLG